MDISGLLMEMCSNLSAREKLAIRNSPNNKMAGHRHRYDQQRRGWCWCCVYHHLTSIDFSYAESRYNYYLPFKIFFRDVILIF